MQPESQEYKGHRIELREPTSELLAAGDEDASGDLQLLIDDEPVPYGKLPDGQFALRDFAYDWTDDLMELARRFIDYREQAVERRGRSYEEER